MREGGHCSSPVCPPSFCFRLHFTLTFTPGTGSGCAGKAW
jgi:hypothetical protein